MNSLWIFIALTIAAKVEPPYFHLSIQCQRKNIILFNIP